MFAFDYGSASYWHWILGAASMPAIVLFTFAGGMIRYIPNDRLGVLEKLWSFSAFLNPDKTY